MSFSTIIESIEKYDTRSGPIEVLKILISFNFEKLLSTVAVVTKGFNNKYHAVITSEKLDARLLNVFFYLLLNVLIKKHEIF